MKMDAELKNIIDKTIPIDLPEIRNYIDRKISESKVYVKPVEIKTYQREISKRKKNKFWGKVINKLKGHKKGSHC